MHAARLRRHGDPEVCIPQAERAYPRGSKHHGWVESPDYRQWHQRLRGIKGPASRHDCSKRCGRQARHWAYVGAETAVMAYSLDPDDYAPMCVSCHKLHDLARLGGFVVYPLDSTPHSGVQ